MSPVADPYFKIMSFTMSSSSLIATASGAVQKHALFACVREHDEQPGPAHDDRPAHRHCDLDVDAAEWFGHHCHDRVCESDTELGF